MRKPTGGFNKPVQWGPWIRDELSQGQQTWGYSLYSAYARFVRSFPLRRGGLRRVASYQSWTTYLYILRTLNLIEYVLDENGDIKTEESVGKDGLPVRTDGKASLHGAPGLAPRYYFQAVMANIASPAWGDPWRAFHELGGVK